MRRCHCRRRCCYCAAALGPNDTASGGTAGLPPAKVERSGRRAAAQRLECAHADGLSVVVDVGVVLLACCQKWGACIVWWRHADSGHRTIRAQHSSTAAAMQRPARRCACARSSPPHLQAPWRSSRGVLLLRAIGSHYLTRFGALHMIKLPGSMISSLAKISIFCRPAAALYLNLRSR